jgi:hypothetical protein
MSIKCKTLLLQKYNLAHGKYISEQDMEPKPKGHENADRANGIN